MPAGYVHDGVHLAADACVVYSHDGLGPVRDRLFDSVLINIHSIRTDIHEYGRRACQNDRSRRAGEGKAGQDDFIALFKAAQKRRHFKGGGAAGRQKRAGRAEAFLDPGVAFLGKLSVTADLVRVDSLFYIIEFRSDERGNVKRYFSHRMYSSFFVHYCHYTIISRIFILLSVGSDLLAFFECIMQLCGESGHPAQKQIDSGEGLASHQYYMVYRKL